MSRVWDWIKRQINIGYLVALALSLLIGLLIGAGILAITGQSFFGSLREILGGSFSTREYVGNMLEYAMVLCLCGLACDIGSRVGIFNVGGEGQLLLGGLIAAQIGVWMKDSSPWLAILCAVLGAIAVGGFYAFIPGILTVKLKVSEVITTIMLNTIAACICAFFAKGLWKNPNRRITEGTSNLRTDFKFTTLIPHSNLTTAIIVSAILTVLIWYILQKSTKGYEMRLTGENPRFARYAGIKADRIVIIAMIVSGMLCGLVGMFRVYGSLGKYQSSISNQYYFEGLMVAMIAQYQPIPTIIISLIFAVLKFGAYYMEEAQHGTVYIYLIIQAAVIFCMAAEKGIRAAIAKSMEKRAARRAIRMREEGGEADV